MDLQELIDKKTAMEAQSQDLLARAEQEPDRAQRRKLRLQAMLIKEDVLTLSDQIQKQRTELAIARAKEERQSKTKEERQRRQDKETNRRIILNRITPGGHDDPEDRDFMQFLADLHERETYDDGTLLSLGRSYRREADAIRHRIQLVTELRTRTEEERIEKEERLRILSSMLRDVRDCAVICERYYDRSYHRNERYTL